MRGGPAIETDVVVMPAHGNHAGDTYALGPSAIHDSPSWRGFAKVNEIVSDVSRQRCCVFMFLFSNNGQPRVPDAVAVLYGDTLRSAIHWAEPH